MHGQSNHSNGHSQLVILKRPSPGRWFLALPLSAQHFLRMKGRYWACLSSHQFKRRIFLFVWFVFNVKSTASWLSVVFARLSGDPCYWSHSTWNVLIAHSWPSSDVTPRHMTPHPFYCPAVPQATPRTGTCTNLWPLWSFPSTILFLQEVFLHKIRGAFNTVPSNSKESPKGLQALFVHFFFPYKFLPRFFRIPPYCL